MLKCRILNDEEIEFCNARAMRRLIREYNDPSTFIAYPTNSIVNICQQYLFKECFNIEFYNELNHLVGFISLYKGKSMWEVAFFLVKKSEQSKYTKEMFEKAVQVLYEKRAKKLQFYLDPTSWGRLKNPEKIFKRLGFNTKIQEGYDKTLNKRDVYITLDLKDYYKEALSFH